jgi:hypothetical protein
MITARGEFAMMMPSFEAGSGLIRPYPPFGAGAVPQNLEKENP